MGKLHVKWPNSLNVDLVRASPMMIDYVICHELAHAFYPTRWLPPLSSARKATLLPGGTGGSNPASSSWESITNHRQRSRCGRATGRPSWPTPCRPLRSHPGRFDLAFRAPAGARPRCRDGCARCRPRIGDLTRTSSGRAFFARISHIGGLTPFFSVVSRPVVRLPSDFFCATVTTAARRD